MFDWVVGVVEKGGYPGIALLMFLENVFPPIPSEIIMPLAGFAAARGSLGFVGVVLAGTAGSVAGAWVWFLVGRWLGAGRIERLIVRHGRLLTMTLDDLDRARDWFRWRANLAVFLGRLVPAIRTLVSVPAGIARMGTGRFLAWTTLGTLIWTALLAAAGYLLEARFAEVEAYVDPVSKGVVGLAVAAYVYRVATYSPARERD